MNYKYIFQLPNKKLVHNSWPLHTINFFFYQLPLRFILQKGKLHIFPIAFREKYACF